MSSWSGYESLTRAKSFQLGISSEVVFPVIVAMQSNSVSLVHCEPHFLRVIQRVVFSVHPVETLYQYRFF